MKKNNWKGLIPTVNNNRYYSEFYHPDWNDECIMTQDYKNRIRRYNYLYDWYLNTDNEDLKFIIIQLSHLKWKIPFNIEKYRKILQEMNFPLKKEENDYFIYSNDLDLYIDKQLRIKKLERILNDENTISEI